MPPNPESKSNLLISERVSEAPAKPKRLELQYDGYMYDITSWVHKHPGGRIIEMYLKTKEDSIHAVQQFHFRSMTRVNAILKSLPKRPINAEDGNYFIYVVYEHERYEIIHHIVITWSVSFYYVVFCNSQFEK